jgi:hypothetical protein
MISFFEIKFFHLAVQGFAMTTHNIEAKIQDKTQIGAQRD